MPAPQVKQRRFVQSSLFCSVLESDFYIFRGHSVVKRRRARYALHFVGASRNNVLTPLLLTVLNGASRNNLLIPLLLTVLNRTSRNNLLIPLLITVLNGASRNNLLILLLLTVLNGASRNNLLTPLLFTVLKIDPIIAHRA